MVQLIALEAINLRYCLSSPSALLCCHPQALAGELSHPPQASFPLSGGALNGLVVASLPAFESWPVTSWPRRCGQSLNLLFPRFPHPYIQDGHSICLPRDRVAAVCEASILPGSQRVLVTACAPACWVVRCISSVSPQTSTFLLRFVRKLTQREVSCPRPHSQLAEEPEPGLNQAASSRLTPSL